MRKRRTRHRCDRDVVRIKHTQCGGFPRQGTRPCDDRTTRQVTNELVGAAIRARIEKNSDVVGVEINVTGEHVPRTLSVQLASHDYSLSPDMSGVSSVVFDPSITKVTEPICTSKGPVSPGSRRVTV